MWVSPSGRGVATAWRQGNRVLSSLAFALAVLIQSTTTLAPGGVGKPALPTTKVPKTDTPGRVHYDLSRLVTVPTAAVPEPWRGGPPSTGKSVALPKNSLQFDLLDDKRDTLRFNATPASYNTLLDRPPLGLAGSGTLSFFIGRPWVSTGRDLELVCDGDFHRKPVKVEVLVYDSTWRELATVELGSPDSRIRAVFATSDDRPPGGLLFKIERPNGVDRSMAFESCTVTRVKP